MTPAQRHCFRYVLVTAQAISAMVNTLGADEVRTALRSADAARRCEAQVDAAALSGSVTATKHACRLWWQAWQTAIRQEVSHAPHLLR